MTRDERIEEIKARLDPLKDVNWELHRYTNYVGWSVYEDGNGCVAERWYAAEHPDEKMKSRAELIAHAPSDLRYLLSRVEEQGSDRISIEVYQKDFIPGWGAFLDDDAVIDGKAHVVLNVGSLMAAVQQGDLDKADLPYMIAETLMHEVVHVLEAWAKVEFSEERVEALLEKYREKYGQPTIWQSDVISDPPPGTGGQVDDDGNGSCVSKTSSDLRCFLLLMGLFA